MLSFDLSLYLSLLFALLVFPSCLFYLGRDNILVWLHKELQSEFENNHSELIAKAKKYTNRTRNTPEKYRIQRLLGRFADDYAIPCLFMWISGVSVLACMYSVFLAISLLIYSNSPGTTLLNLLFVTGEFTLVSMVVLWWYTKWTGIEKPVFYLLTNIIWGLFVFLISFIDVRCSIFFEVIAPEHINTVFLSFIAIPFIPLAVAFLGLCYYFVQEYKFYRNLQRAVADYEWVKEEAKKKPKAK